MPVLPQFAHIASHLFYRHHLVLLSPPSRCAYCADTASKHPELRPRRSRDLTLTLSSFTFSFHLLDSSFTAAVCAGTGIAIATCRLCRSTAVAFALHLIEASVTFLPASFHLQPSPSIDNVICPPTTSLPTNNPHLPNLPLITPLPESQEHIPIGKQHIVTEQR